MKAELTVLMPVYNCEKYVGQAINSILSQTYKDFVFYIIDDGSTDNTASIVEEYSLKDDRICFYKQDNKGLINTLNIHFPKITTPYVARMDGDDECAKNRLELQLSFLKSNEEIGIVGTGISYMDENLEAIIYNSKFPATHNHIMWRMLYKTGIGHANLMMKTKLFQNIGVYNNDALHVEDYEFFLRASKATKLANLDAYLYRYRRHGGSVSLKYKEVQKRNHIFFSKKNIENYLPSVTDDFVNFLKYDLVKKEADPVVIFASLKMLYHLFVKVNSLSSFEKKLVKEEVENKMFKLAAYYKRRNIFTCLFYYRKYLFFRMFN